MAGKPENHSRWQEERVNQRRQANKALAEAKEYEESHKLYKFRFKNGLEIAHTSKLRLEEIKKEVINIYGYKM